MENINDRFSSIPVLDALAVLDPRNLPQVNRLAGYGDPQIRIKEEQAMSEWLLCRHLMSSTFRGQTMEEFGSVILSSHQDAFPIYHFCWLLDLLYQSQMLDVRGDSHAKIE